MRLRHFLMLLAVMSLAAGCARPGDFCDVSSPALLASDAVADYIHGNDPALEKWIIIHNRFWIAHCE